MKEKNNEEIRNEAFEKCLQIANVIKFEYEKKEKITITSLVLSLLINIIAISGLVVMLLK